MVDATVPLAAAVSGRATRLIGVWQGSAAQQAAEMVPAGVRVVSALHTVSAAVLRDPAQTPDEDVLVCGDKKADKARAVEIIERMPGLRCVDCGRLEQSRITESLTALLIGVNRATRPTPASGSPAFRSSCGSPRRSPCGRDGRRQARPRDARRGRRGAGRGRQHRRRRRDPRRACLPRPRPCDVLARRPHRRARLGAARRHLPRDGGPARARRGGVVQPRRPRPRALRAARAAAGGGRAADRGDRRGAARVRRRGASAAGVRRPGAHVRARGGGGGRSRTS